MIVIPGESLPDRRDGTTNPGGVNQKPPSGRGCSRNLPRGVENRGKNRQRRGDQLSRRPKSRLLIGLRETGCESGCRLTGVVDTGCSGGCSTICRWATGVRETGVRVAGEATGCRVGVPPTGWLTGVRVTGVRVTGCRVGWGFTGSKGIGSGSGLGSKPSDTDAAEILKLAHRDRADRVGDTRIQKAGHQFGTEEILAPVAVGGARAALRFQRHGRVGVAEDLVVGGHGVGSGEDRARGAGALDEALELPDRAEAENMGHLVDDHVDELATCLELVEVGGVELHRALPGQQGAISAKFPEVREIGGVRPDSMHWHPDGLAIDVIIPDWHTPAGRSLGDRVVEYVFANAERFGLEYVIWQRTYLPAKGKPRVMEDRGGPDANHDTHVHISTYGGGFPTGRETYYE